MWEKSKLRWEADRVDKIMDGPVSDEFGHLASVELRGGETEDSAGPQGGTEPPSGFIGTFTAFNVFKKYQIQCRYHHLYSKYSQLLYVAYLAEGGFRV